MESPPVAADPAEDSEGGWSSDKKKKSLSWSPKVLEAPKPISKASAFDVLVGDDDIEDDVFNIDNAVCKSGPGSPKKSSPKRDSPKKSKKPSPTKTNATAKEKSSPSVSSYSHSWQLIAIYAVFAVMVIFSISDFGLGDLYRGNEGINRILVARGLFQNASDTGASPKELARSLLKRYVQVDSEIFERPLTEQQRRDGVVQQSVLGMASADGAYFPSAEQLQLQITSPKENAIITPSAAQLSMTATGSALWPLHLHAAMLKAREGEDSSKPQQLPTTRKMRLLVTLDGTELSFLSGSEHTIALDHELSISFDLTDHGLSGGDFGMGVHLVEVVLLLEAIPEYEQGLLTTVPGVDVVDSQQNALAVLGAVRTTTSVAFLYLTDPPLLNLHHPRLQPESNTVSLDVSGKGEVVELWVDVSPATLSLPGVRAVFSLGDSTHVDVTEVLREQFTTTDGGTPPDSVQRVRLGLQGDLRAGKHLAAVTLVRIPEDQQSWSPEEVVKKDQRVLLARREIKLAMV
jgi:hypothetical protein